MAIDAIGSAVGSPTTYTTEVMTEPAGLVIPNPAATKAELERSSFELASVTPAPYDAVVDEAGRYAVTDTGLTGSVEQLFTNHFDQLLQRGTESFGDASEPTFPVAVDGRTYEPIVSDTGDVRRSALSAEFGDGGLGGLGGVGGISGFDGFDGFDGFGGLDTFGGLDGLGGIEGFDGFDTGTFPVDALGNFSFAQMPLPALGEMISGLDFDSLVVAHGSGLSLTLNGEPAGRYDGMHATYSLNLGDDTFTGNVGALFNAAFDLPGFDAVGKGPITGISTDTNGNSFLFSGSQAIGIVNWHGDFGYRTEDGTMARGNVADLITDVLDAASTAHDLGLPLNTRALDANLAPHFALGAGPTGYVDLGDLNVGVVNGNAIVDGKSVGTVSLAGQYDVVVDGIHLQGNIADLPGATLHLSNSSGVDGSGAPPVTALVDAFKIYDPPSTDTSIAGLNVKFGPNAAERAVDFAGLKGGEIVNSLLDMVHANNGRVDYITSKPSPTLDSQALVFTVTQNGATAQYAVHRQSSDSLSPVISIRTQGAAGDDVTSSHTFYDVNTGAATMGTTTTMSAQTIDRNTYGSATFNQYGPSADGGLALTRSTTMNMVMLDDGVFTLDARSTTPGGGTSRAEIIAHTSDDGRIIANTTLTKPDGTRETARLEFKDLAAFTRFTGGNSLADGSSSTTTTTGLEQLLSGP